MCFLPHLYKSLLVLLLQVNYWQCFCLAHFHKYLKVCLLLWAIWFLLIRWHYTITCLQTRCCHFDNWSQCWIVDNNSMLRIILFVLAVLCSKIETTIKYHIYNLLGGAKYCPLWLRDQWHRPLLHLSPALKISLPHTQIWRRSRKYVYAIKDVSIKTK